MEKTSKVENKSTAKSKIFSLKNVFIVVGLALTILALYGLSRYNYLLFHSSVEVFTVVIALIIFAISWNSRHIMDNNYLSFVGFALLFVAVLDLIHGLAFKGMGVFPGITSNLATQLWIATRYLFGFSMLIPLVLINRKIKFTTVLVSYSLVTLFLMLSIFYWGVFPVAFVEGSGLTIFKIVSEYVISAILATSIIFLVKNKKAFNDSVFRFLVVALVLGIATELSFTLYTDVYGIANMVGHLLDLVSFFFIYKALVETGFNKPFDLLFRNLKQSESNLASRALELANTNDILEMEMAERKKIEKERGTVTKFLQLANSSKSTIELVTSSINFFQRESGCEAVGIRLKEGDDYPYYQSNGFPLTHLQLENSLCIKGKNGKVIRDEEGNPFLECMCGNIICGRFDPTKDFFTAKGSFWTNSTTDLLSKTTDTDRQAYTRNRCNGEGYESVALIALKVGSDQGGLLQLNDKRKNMFTIETIHMWERIADELALALSKTIIEELAIKRAEDLEQLQCKLENKAAEVEEYASQMEQLAQQRLSQLKDSERMAAIGQIAGMVGHDIRNPLQAITSDLYLAKSELFSVPDSEEKSNAIESLVEIEKNIDYINKIVADLQDYSRPIKPVVSNADLFELFSDVFLSIKIPEDIVTDFKVDEEAKQLVTDPGILKRVLFNLTNNAIQAMPQGGKLSIKAFLKENKVVITVKDTGVGIPEDVKPKLFTPLFTTKSKGQGFGLAVVKRMMESLDGSVTFESEVGKGTMFVLQLPKGSVETQK